MANRVGRGPALLAAGLAAVLAVLWGGLVAPAAADGPKGLTDLSLIYPREDLFITATQSARTLDRAPAIATVVTAREIRDMGARDLLDVLATVPGFGISFASDYATIESIEVRGLKSDDSEKVLLLIDGHPVNSLFAGSPTHYFDAFPVDAIRRIEIIRGPGSALYGANAFVAVINVILVKPGDLEGARLTAGAGSAARTHENLLLGHRQGGLSMVADYDHLDTNGTRDFIARDAAGNSGTTHHWQDNHTGYVRAHAGDLDLVGLVIRKHRAPAVGITNQVDTRSDLRVQQAYAGATETRHLGSTRAEASLSVDQLWWDTQWQLDVPGFAATGEPMVTTQTLTGGITLRFEPVTGHHLTVAGTYAHGRMYDVRHVVDGVDVSATFNHAIPAQRKNGAVTLQDEWAFSPDGTVTAGVRWDHYSELGNTVNPRLAAVWSPVDHLTAKLLYGRAFRAPSFQELYEINNPVVLGNPDLKPEIMNTLEAGLVWKPAAPYTVTGNAFFNRFSRRIVHQAPQIVNAGSAEVWGTELELKADWREHRYGYLNWSWNTTEQEGSEIRLPDVPHNQVKGGLNWGLCHGWLNTNLEARWRGRQPRPTGDTRPPTPAATVVDLALHTDRVAPGLTLGLSVHNVLDTAVYDPSPPTVPDGYPRPGRTWLAEARYRY